MRVNIWDTEIRHACSRIDHILRDMNTDETGRLYHVFQDVFRRAYSTSSDWPVPNTRVITCVPLNDETRSDVSPTHTAMRQYTRSRGCRGLLLTRQHSTHVVRTVLRMTGIEFREKITSILSECIQTYSDKLPYLVVQCPETWLFVESAHGILLQCTDGRCPSSGALVHLAALLPSKTEWCKLSEEMRFKVGSVEANTHLWCWFRLNFLFSDFISYANAWTSGVVCENGASVRCSSVP